MDVKTHFKAGGSFVNLPPQFSSTAENIYVVWKNTIFGYNTKTGVLFAEFRGIKDRIVGFGVHYYDSYECVTACSSSGEVIIWKVVTHFKLLNKKIGKQNIATFHVVPTEANELKVLISYKENNQILFEVCDLNNETSQECLLRINPNRYYVDLNGKFLAVSLRNSLHIVLFSDLKITYTYYIEKSRVFTCIACHPENDIVLTGDNTGRVVVWQKLFPSNPAKAVCHWHTLPVKCLGFSTQGSYFYSGGDESVLVRWQLDNHFEKKFLPRLPSTLAQVTVSPKNLFIAISTNDNAVRIVDPRLDNVSLIQHLVIGSTFETGIVVDPKTKALVMNGNVGQIQFYSSHDNSLLYNVDVVGQNKVSNERTCNIENTQVSKIAISKNGLWMGTVEIRKDPDYSSELRLKFWNFDTNIQNFKLNTLIEEPHENHVNSIAFQPTDNTNELKLVSIGGDKKFKVWYLTEVETVNSISQIWKCLCMGFYHDLSCKDLSFSIDGSLLAVSFGKIVTTWLPDTCQLKCSLVHPVCKAEIKQVEFGNGNQCHLLVTASDERLCVWNLLTLTLLWTVPADISILIADAVTANMAIITEDNIVYVFSPLSPEPVFSSHKLLRKHKKIYAAVFVPTKYSNDVRLSWYQRSPIFYLNEKQELFCISSEEDISDTTTDMEKINNSLFSMTVPQTQVDKNKANEPVQHLYQKDMGQKNIKKYLEAPIQTMIPIRIMCSSLLKSMVIQKS